MPHGRPRRPRRQCDHCGHRRVWYNSCRNRHCPTCQSLARAAWLERRRADLLPTEYYHVVFTVPPAVAEVAIQNKAVVYGLLFRAVADTLRTIAADPRHLGAEIGFFAVLHTWGQTLVHHPHLHCVIPGGGAASDGSDWVACRPGFFLPVRVLSRYFRRVLLAALQDAFESGKLRFTGRLQALSDPRRFAEHLRPAREAEWVVYAKRPFAGPGQVLDYLGRYTHRIAIGDQRLCSLDGGSVRFRYADYRRAGASRQRTMTLTATEFIRLSSNGCGWVEARSAGRRGVLAARVASELTAHGVHLTGGGRGAPWPGVGRSGVAAGRPACQRATRVLRCATALRVTHRPSLRSSSRYGPCGPAWTGASRPSTTTRKARRLAVRG